MENWTSVVDQILDDIQSVIMSLLVKLGPFAVALMPSLFTSYAIYHTFKGEAGIYLAFAFAVIVGVAIETVGIISTHTAIDLYNAFEEEQVDWIKLMVMVSLVPVYVLGVSGTVWYAEGAFTPLVSSLGIVSPFLTVIVYIAVALARDLRRIEAKAKQKEAKEEKINAEMRKERREDKNEQRQYDLERYRMELEARVKLTELERKPKEEEAKVYQNNGNLPEWLPVVPQDRNHFRQLVKEGIISLPEYVTGSDLANHIPTVGSSRTGQNWLADVRNGNGK